MKRRDRAITDEDVRRRLRINVRSLREAASLTVKQAAARVKMHRRHWQKVESGTVNITVLTLTRLGVALGVSPVTLLREPPARGPALDVGIASPGTRVIWFGPVASWQVKGATVRDVKPQFVTCTGDGSDGRPTCAARAEAWKDASGRRLPGLFKWLNIKPGEVTQLYLGAFSAGGQSIKRIALHATDRAMLTGVLLSDGTYTTEWLDQKKGIAKPIEGFLRYAVDCISDGRLFLATASSTPNKNYPSGAQSLDGIRRGIESELRCTLDDAMADPIWKGLKPPVRAWRKRNVIFADFGAAYKHNEHATRLAPILWPRALAFAAQICLPNG